jgi:hypothetical protein
MFTIEMLMIDWDDRDAPEIVERIPFHAGRLGDAFMVAKALLDDAPHAGPNAFRIRDGEGEVVLRSWERRL